ncbi:hypothetical protein A0H76_395 [Hepatospora eriocheir]|uniref:Uncharacterized protein n=1 Tax=Hepatospora eriocheir TaxID=1081669 RepID=A0A1X0QB18_9MICR|nr:hypothetical protein A0H76_395 [Hepatospora eriocheir]
MIFTRLLTIISIIRSIEESVTTTDINNSNDNLYNILSSGIDLTINGKSFRGIIYPGVILLDIYQNQSVSDDLITKTIIIGASKFSLQIEGYMYYTEVIIEGQAKATYTSLSSVNVKSDFQVKLTDFHKKISGYRVQAASGTLNVQFNKENKSLKIEGNLIFDTDVTSNSDVDSKKYNTTMNNTTSNNFDTFGFSSVDSYPVIESRLRSQFSQNDFFPNNTSDSPIDLMNLDNFINNLIG